MSNRPEIKRWVSVLAVVGFIIFFVYLIFFTDIVAVTVIISGVSFPLYFLVFVFVIIEAVFNSLAWKATLDNISVKTTFKRVFYLGWVGAFLDCIILGGWTGDIFMTYLLGKDEGVDIIKVAASVIVKDVLELLVTLVSLIIGMTLLILNYSINTFIVTAIGITMIFFAFPLILIVYLSTNISLTKRLLQFLVKIIARIKRKKPSDAFQQKIVTQITDFHEAIMIMKKKPRSMIKPLIFQTMAWVCNIVALYLVFVSLGSIIGLDKIVITNTIISSVSNQGIALSGFSQMISSNLYQVLGINVSMAEASSLLAGFASFWFVFVISFVFFQLYGLGTIEEKLLLKAFKEKKKEDTRQFNDQTESNERDFEEKTQRNKEDFNQQNITREKKFKEKSDNDKSDYEEQKDIDEKSSREFNYQTESNERDYKEKTQRNKDKFHQQNIIRKKKFKQKSDNDKSDYEEQRDIDKKSFRERMDEDKKRFQRKDSED